MRYWRSTESQIEQIAAHHTDFVDNEQVDTADDIALELAELIAFLFAAAKGRARHVWRTETLCASATKHNIMPVSTCLVIDEISMVRSDLLDAVDSVLRQYQAPHLPFRWCATPDDRRFARVVTPQEEHLLGQIAYHQELHTTKRQIVALAILAKHRILASSRSLRAVLISSITSRSILRMIYTELAELIAFLAAAKGRARHVWREGKLEERMDGHSSGVDGCNARRSKHNHSFWRHLFQSLEEGRLTCARLSGKEEVGTGKTTFLKRLKELSPKQMIVLAPTGIAAINAGGMTIPFVLPASLLAIRAGHDLGSGEQKRYQFGELKRKNIIRSIDLLVINEMGCVRSDLLDAVDSVLRQYRKRHDLPFGGVQLLMIGDLQQLAPVVLHRKSICWGSIMILLSSSAATL